jgi:subtilase family serine protease
MKRTIWVVAAVVLLVAGLTAAGMAQNHKIIVPQSSIAKPGDAGVRMHTNLRIAVQPSDLKPSAINPQIGPPFTGYSFDTPGSLNCVYNMVPQTPGCNPYTALTLPNTGSRAIAVVDAFHNPFAVTDLRDFSAQFGLPAPDVTVVYATGVKPPVDLSGGGWILEGSLDLQYAHAMAPNAKLYLVEGKSNGLSDLLLASDVAASLVAAAGGGEVSMSYSGGEFFGEQSFEKRYKVPGVVYFASSGDAITPGNPSVLANVVSVGGTEFDRDANFDFVDEHPWASAGVGDSLYIPRPASQASISSIVGRFKGTPDVSFNGGCNSAVWVHAFGESISGVSGWYALCGTSLSSPAFAGVVNSAGSFASGTQSYLQTLYPDAGNSSVFNDVSTGTCGTNGVFSATPGWDFCTGLGSPNGLTGK